MSARIVPLRSLGSGDTARAGGKACGLARLIAAGLPVPDGFVVTCDAYRDHVAALAASLREPLAALARPDRRPDAAAAIRAAIERAPLPASLAAEVAAALAAWGEVAVAVRSSAVAEDLAEASFAGQHDSFLDVRGPAPVADALRRCWSSLFSDRAVDYRARRGFGHDGAIAVVVQRMVAADAAGVAFTADPRTGERDRIVVDAVRGLGESLVSGRATADEYLLRKPDGGLLQRRLAGATPVLDASLLPELSRLALAAERAAGSPQDVEWAVAGGRPTLLQSRAITSLPPEPVPLADAERPLLGYLDRWREMFPSAGTPLLNDLALRCILPLVTRNLVHHGLLPASLAAQAAQFGRIVRGRLFLELTWFQAAVAPGLDEVAVVDLLEAGKPPPLRALRPSTLVMLLRQAPRALPALVRAMRRLDAMERESVATLDRLVAPLERLDPASLGVGQLLAILKLEPSPEFVAELVASPPANALARGFATPFYVALGWICRRWAGEPQATASELVAGLTGMVEVDCAAALWELAQAARGTPVEAALADPATALDRLGAEPAAAAWLQFFRAFLERYGHRAILEVELARPRWREEPAYPLSVIAAYLRCGPEADPREVQRARRARRHALEERILGRLRRRPLRRALFRAALEIAQRASRAGENTKFEIMRLFWVMRVAALELGRRLAAAGRLAAADDVFFLALDEIGGPADAELRPLVARRRTEYEQWQKEDAPRVIDARGRPVREGLRRSRHAHEDASVLVGTGSSAGVARGVVRIVTDPGAGVRLLPGEILVAPYTDPAWTPLFVPAAAVVVEIGSLLSHASIVAREMGIPSVVGVAGATSELRDGELVEVDGTAGLVRRLGAAAGPPAGRPAPA